MSVILGQLSANGVTVAPQAVKARRNPTATDKLEVGQWWVNMDDETAFILVAYDNGVPVWQGTGGSGGGGTITADALIITPGPTELTGIFTVDADVDQAGVITLREDGGTSGSILIESAQGTSSDSISLQSGAGGIEITTNGAAGDIAITSNLGRVTIGSGENIADSVELLVDGGVLSGLTLLNTAGTDVDSIHLGSTLGGIEIITEAAGKNIVLSSNLGSINLVSAENVTDSIILESSGGVLSTITISNTAGTNDANPISTASIRIVSDLGGIGIEAGKDLNVEAVDTSTITVTTGDLALATQTGDITSTATLGDIELTATAGAIELVSNTSSSWTGADSINIFPSDTSFFTVTGASKNLNLSSVGGSVIVEANEAAADAVVIKATDTAGGIDVDAGTAGIAVDTTGAFSIDGAAASNVTTTGAAVDLTLSSVLGSVNVLASESVANAIRVNATGAAGGIDIDSLTGGIALDTTGASNFTITGAVDLTLRSTAGSVVVNGGEAVIDAIQLNASNAAGGITATVGSNNLNVVGGNIVMPTAATGLVLTPAPATPVSFLAGSGDPNGSVTAGQGSIYLRVDGSSTSTRAYINSNAGTTWVAITTAS